MIKTVIIVAGGVGTRMSSSIPKQFLLLKGMPILMHSIKAFFDYDKTIEIILALPEFQFEYWEDLCVQYQFKIDHRVVKGGETRFESVRNALSFANSDGLIAIHDGVRPLVSQQTIKFCFEKAEKQGSAIPVVDITDSVRKIELNTNRAVDRSALKAVQTPQIFKAYLVKKAYSQPYQPQFTDDAGVVESMGQAVFLVEGNKENIKITTPLDIKIAEALI